MSEFQQIVWDDLVEEDCRALVRLAVREDLERGQDWTTVALVAADDRGAADIVLREPGIVAGMPTIELVLDEMQADITAELARADGQPAVAGDVLARLRGNVRDLLTCERTMLNLLGRLLGIATTTSEFAEQLSGTNAKIYDTRKTTLGWRRLEKYAVHCGGGQNHRLGLYDAVLIKDNHLAQCAATASPADAVRLARDFLAAAPAEERIASLPVEVEVDTLAQLAEVLQAGPDIVLLDNMTIAELENAVALRNESAPNVQLEASGGIRRDTLRQVAASGVERISSGALTHAVRSLDVGLDWHTR